MRSCRIWRSPTRRPARRRLFLSILFSCILFSFLYRLFVLVFHAPEKLNIAGGRIKRSFFYIGRLESALPEMASLPARLRYHHRHIKDTDLFWMRRQKRRIFFPLRFPKAAKVDLRRKRMPADQEIREFFCQKRGYHISFCAQSIEDMQRSMNMVLS